MPPKPLAAPPDRFTAGDTVSWMVPRVAVGEFPVGQGWQLRVRLAGPSTLSVVAAEIDGDYVVTLPADQTATLARGVYRLTHTAHMGAMRYSVGDVLLVQVAPDPAGLDDGDAVTYAERQHARFQKLYEQVSADPLAEYQVDGDTRRRWTLDEVQRQLGYWAERVIAQRRGGKLRYVRGTTGGRT